MVNVYIFLEIFDYSKEGTSIIKVNIGTDELNFLIINMTFFLIHFEPHYMNKKLEKCCLQLDYIYRIDVIKNFNTYRCHPTQLYGFCKFTSILHVVDSIVDTVCSSGNI